jgi:hypothetical protein
MFVPDADLDRKSLRQGDILAGIPFPLIDLPNTVALGRLSGEPTANTLPSLTAVAENHRGDREWFSTVTKTRLCFCAVLSNCCDIEPRNGRILLPAVALARLRPIPPDFLREPARLASLQQNKNPSNPDDPGYIDYFCFDNHPRLENEQMVVHYNQLICIPSSAQEQLMQRKILQLDDRARVKFKLKLAFSLARLGDAEIAAGLQNPWE